MINFRSIRRLPVVNFLMPSFPWRLRAGINSCFSCIANKIKRDFASGNPCLAVVSEDDLWTEIVGDTFNSDNMNKRYCDALDPLSFFLPESVKANITEQRQGLVQILQPTNKKQSDLEKVSTHPSYHAHFVPSVVSDETGSRLAKKTRGWISRKKEKHKKFRTNLPGLNLGRGVVNLHLVKQVVCSENDTTPFRCAVRARLRQPVVHWQYCHGHYVQHLSRTASMGVNHHLMSRKITPCQTARIFITSFTLDHACVHRSTLWWCCCC